MITETQIIEAAKECCVEKDCLDFYVASDEELTKFAQHWYKIGLLDAAEKCASLPSFEFDGHEERTTNPDDCAEEIRAMAEEIKCKF